MDIIITEDDFEYIYGNEYFWIGRLVGVEYYSYWLITTDGRAAQNNIAIRIKEKEVKQILDSNGNMKVVEDIKRKFYAGHIVVEPSKKHGI